MRSESTEERIVGPATPCDLYCVDARRAGEAAWEDAPIDTGRGEMSARFTAEDAPAGELFGTGRELRIGR